MTEFFKKKKKLLLCYLIALGTLLAEFVLCRYVFFGIHGMREWPFDLFVFGLAALLISLFSRKRYMPVFISAGYMIGFILGVIFQTDGYDPGGGRTNSLWMIWTVVFAGSIGAGVIFECAAKWKRLLKRD